MGADYSFYVKIIETHARTFFKVIILTIGSVSMYVFKMDYRLRTQIKQTNKLKFLDCIEKI